MEGINFKSVYLIIPVHNRKIVTLNCLWQLRENKILGNYNIIIIDDGSVDGTFEAIQLHYPEVVILKADGTLWWTGAIHKGMEYAYCQGAKYIVWMNDDTLPCYDALSLMVENCEKNPNTIISAQCYADQEFKIPTYGGQKKGFLSLTLFHTPLGEIYPCDCMSGNLVCFPRSVIEKIGFPPSERLPHNCADIVYTWTAKKAGYNLIVCGDATAVCSFNPYEEGWSSSLISMRQRWSMLMSYKSNLYPPAFWYYCQQFYDFLAPFVFLKAYLSLIFFTLLRLILPLSVLTRLKQFKNTLIQEKSPKKLIDNHKI
jgi:GT2 family glycosyltransferase